jgi:trimeric autotransporter adhesin
LRDEKRYVVCAEEKPTAFVEQESFKRAVSVLDRRARFSQTRRRQKDLNQAEDFCPLDFFASSRPAIVKNNSAGKQKGNIPMNPLIQLKKATPPFLGFFVLVCLTLSPRVQAVVPPPDGGYPNFNTAEGTNALKNLTTGVGNTAVGWFSLWSNTDGSFNTGVGAGTLLFNVGDQSTGEGVNNTALGGAALLFNTIGSENTALGTQALLSNTEGASNTAVGRQALISNTTGNNNTANGFQALYFNTTGNNNTATGYAALAFNTSHGESNTANGYEALFHNATGAFNTANGVNALLNNTTGGANTADGVDALHFNTTGANNTATGDAALFHNSTGFQNTADGIGTLGFNTIGSNNTAVGFDALITNTTGSDNTALGDTAGSGVTTASNVIAIGAGVVGENVSNICYIGNIFGVTSTGGAGVFVNSVGKLGTATSSRRFKDDIKPMDQASEVILALKPVTFHYKKEIDPEGRSHFGLVAEDVERVNPDLVVRDKEGKPYSVRYDQVNAMLLNEFLKEHQKVQALEKQVEKLTAGLGKVNAQLEASKPTPQVVNNP